jgi:hypothetical protein
MCHPSFERLTRMRSNRAKHRANIAAPDPSEAFLPPPNPATVAFRVSGQYGIDRQRTTVERIGRANWIRAAQSRVPTNPRDPVIQADWETFLTFDDADWIRVRIVFHSHSVHASEIKKLRPSTVAPKIICHSTNRRD